MIYFGTLGIHDFGVISAAEVPLHDRGLVLIQGANDDSAAADSNGSGKTTVLRALAWALFGKTLEGMAPEGIVRRGATTALVKLDFIVDGEAYTVLRKRTVKTGSLNLLKGDEDISGRTQKDTQEAIENLLGMDLATFRNTVLFGQNDLGRFADPTTTDTERKTILRRVLRLDRLDDALERAKEDRKERERKELRARTLEATALNKIDALDLERAKEDWRLAADDMATHLAELDDEVVAWRSDLAALKKKAARRDKIVSLLPRIDDKIEAFADARDRHNELLQQSDELDALVRAAHTEAATRTSEVALCDSQLADLADGVCPVCETPMDGDYPMAKRARIEEEKAAHREAWTWAQERARELTETKNALKAAIAVSEGKLADGAEWTAKKRELSHELRGYSGVETETERITRYIDGLDRRKQEHRDRVSTLEARYNELLDRRAALEEERAAAERDVERAIEAKRQTEFWLAGFGNRGLTSFVIDSVVPTLEARANEYLTILADGDISVSIDTETTLKGGGVRDVLNIVPTVEGHSGVWASGGQQRKIELAIDLALMDLVSDREAAAMDLLCLDEVFAGLDAEGCARVITLLRHLRSRRSTIVVIAHEPAMKEHFERVLRVHKRAGAAVIESA